MYFTEDLQAKFEFYHEVFGLTDYSARGPKYTYGIF